MSLSTTPHLNFRGEARAALEFYQSVFGGDPVVVTYADAGVPVPEAERGNVIWGQLATPAGLSVMAYDVPLHLAHARGENSFFVSLRGTDPAEIERCWRALSDGAVIRQPLAASGWSALYGMLQDRFGIVWVLDLEATAPSA